MDTQTIEGNKLIAEFMGTKVKPDGYFINNYLYHSSWDWLMPVVEKIAQIVYEEGFDNGERIIDTAYPRTFGMINSETKEFMVRINHCSIYSSKTLITATWLAVVDFIKYHNTTKPLNP